MSYLIHDLGDDLSDQYPAWFSMGDGETDDLLIITDDQCHPELDDAKKIVAFMVGTREEQLQNARQLVRTRINEPSNIELALFFLRKALENYPEEGDDVNGRYQRSLLKTAELSTMELIKKVFGRDL